MGKITILYETLGDRLDAARDRVFAAVLHDRAAGDDVREAEVVPSVLAMMQILCDDGDEAVCELTRAWLWTSAETALMEFGEAHELRILSGGTDAAKRWAAFVRGAAR